MGNAFKCLRKRSVEDDVLENPDSTQSITYASVPSHDEVSVQPEAMVPISPSVKFSWNHLQSTYLEQARRPSGSMIDLAVVQTMKNIFQVVRQNIAVLHMKFYDVMLETDRTFPTYFEECAANNQRSQMKGSPLAERMRLHVLGIIHFHWLIITALDNFDEAETFHILKLVAVSHMLMKVQPSHFSIVDSIVAKFLLNIDLLNEDTAEAVAVYFNFVTTCISNYMKLQSQDTKKRRESKNEKESSLARGYPKQLGLFQLIANELCRRAGIAATWLPMNKLGVFTYKHLKAHSPDKPSVYAPADASVFEVRQQAILFEPILRKLLNEANGTFLSVQELMASNSAEFKSELLKLSRQYRSIVRACLENLQDEVMRETSEQQREELQNYITIFYSVECVWHICEILFVDNIPGNIVLPHLLEWVRFHFPKYERKAAVLLAGDLVGLESQPEYWETVVGSLMQGRIEVVRALLRLHSAADSKPFKLADQTLKAMPLYSIYSGISPTEFNLKWKHWLVDTQSKIDSKLFISEKHLHLMMRLAVGEETAWNEVQSHCEAWYELLAAWLFFTDPTIKSFELGQFARRCITRMGVAMHMRHLDQVLLAAMESDIIQVIREIQHMSENGWFVCHLTDLLYHAGRLDFLDTSEADDLVASRLRECFLLDYGTLMMGHNSLWQVGLSYLDHCPTDGINTIELLMARLPLGSEARAQKIIREAQKRDLPHVIQSISKILGINSLKRGRLGNALTWALKSQDGSFTSILADKFLREYSSSGVLRCTDLLDNLGSCMLVSDRLIFLGKYFEFHKVYEAKNYKEAANLIISLLASKLTPKYFWVTLLSDALPLLECNELVMSSNDTYTLLHCLEEKCALPELQDKIGFIRLAIARNLARALTQEAQLG